ncbi:MULTISPECIES: CaiB/BaiF CoA transferase family protein [Thermomonosporaceae]|uniref:CaiB/BaiF CoA transferase family protein n=1 Tax=Thermomonosporaceae TaxID=2012 RepID=UPI00255AFE6E|nr:MULTISPECIES: CoA transferase [Thermomonosporaceae]MDL4775254.1 CoA transferase [Actinomadura xylanilytica]
MTERRTLDGIVVLDLSQVYNGPYCTMLLAQLGAEIIKIEPFGGEPVRWRVVGEQQTAAFDLLNGGKKSLRLNLKDPRGRDLFLRLVAQADVVVENFAPGTLQRLSLGYEVLAQANERIILASGRGFGASTPQAGQRAMDLTIQAVTGVMATTGRPDQPPTKAGPAVADFFGGTHLMGAIAAALYQRTVTGRGQHVEVAMQDAVIPSLTSSIAGYLDSGGTLPERTGNRHGGLAVCPYNVYPTADGWVAILCMTDGHWQTLCRLMNRADLADDPAFTSPPARVAQMDKLDEIVATWTAELTRDDVAGRLQEAGVPCSAVLGLSDVMSGPLVGADGMIRPVSDAAGRRAYVFGSPLRLAASAPLPAEAAATLGEHTEEVLEQRLGLDAAEVRQLRDDNVV